MRRHGRTIRDNGLARRGSVHSGQLERWLGADVVEQVSRTMKNWYGPPIALAGVPGAVFADKDGDFVGEIRVGYEASAMDKAREVARRLARGWRHSVRSTQMNAGFASLSELIAAMSAGSRYEFAFQKAGATGVVNVTNSLWGLGNLPAAGASAAAAPGGEAPTDATTGAFPFTNPGGGDTLHYVYSWATSSVAANSLMLYDRIFAVNKTMASTATESVTGVPTRYQSSTATAADYAGGNFIFVEVGVTALAATAHNWTVCLYRNQAGTDAQTMPSLTGNSGAIVRRLDHPVGQWFAPLATGDIGAMDLNQMQCSASVATGVINFVIGHPIAIVPCPAANLACTDDGINTAPNLARIFDDAALALLELPKPATTATTYSGGIRSAWS